MAYREEWLLGRCCCERTLLSSSSRRLMVSRRCVGRRPAPRVSCASSSALLSVKKSPSSVCRAEVPQPRVCMRRQQHGAASRRLEGEPRCGGASAANPDTHTRGGTGVEGGLPDCLR